MTEHLSRTEVGILWFDLFETNMDEALPNRSQPECVIELLARVTRRHKQDALSQLLSRSFPHVLGDSREHRQTAGRDADIIQQMLEGCYRRSVFTRTHAQIDIDAMFASLADCSRLVRSTVPRVQDSTLKQHVANATGALDGIERIHNEIKAAATGSDWFQRIDAYKLEILRQFTVLAKSVELTFPIPVNLLEDCYFTKEEADEPPIASR